MSSISGTGSGASLQLEPVDTFQPIEDRLDAPSGLEDLFDPPASGGVHLLSEQLRLAHDDGQRIVDLVRGRGGEARDIPEGVALPDGRLGLLSVGNVTGDRRHADDPPLRVQGRRDRLGHIDPPPILRHPHGVIVIDPLAPPEPLEDPRQLAVELLRDDEPDRPPDDFPGRVPVEPLGAAVPARDDAFERLADDRVVRGLDDRGDGDQRRFGPAALRDDRRQEQRHDGHRAHESLEQQERFVLRAPDEGPEALQRSGGCDHGEEGHAGRRFALLEPERSQDEWWDAQELEGIIPHPR